MGHQHKNEFYSLTQRVRFRRLSFMEAQVFGLVDIKGLKDFYLTNLLSYSFQFLPSGRLSFKFSHGTGQQCRPRNMSSASFA